MQALKKKIILLPICRIGQKLYLFFQAISHRKEKKKSPRNKTRENMTVPNQHKKIIIESNY